MTMGHEKFARPNCEKNIPIDIFMTHHLSPTVTTTSTDHNHYIERQLVKRTSKVSIDMPSYIH